MRAHAAEFLGTFALVFAGCGAIAVQLPPPGTALTFGLVIAVMIYALGRISGAHFNPAVSIAFALAGHVAWFRAGTYIVAQGCGAVAGAAVLRLLAGTEVSVGVTRPAGGVFLALGFETVLTFFLVLVILAVALDTRVVREAAVLVIGGAVALGALVGGPVSGGSMNPARSLGPALVAGEVGHLAIYLAGPILGAVLAATASGYLRRTQVS